MYIAGNLIGFGPNLLVPVWFCCSVAFDVREEDEENVCSDIPPQKNKTKLVIFLFQFPGGSDNYLTISGSGHPFLTSSEVGLCGFVFSP